jgi:uncharacterized membrane protein
MTTEESRAKSIDLLRGFAILLMLLANLSPYFYLDSTPLFLRLLYSMAAPTFVFLSGYSAFAFSREKNQGFPFAFWRVIFAAAFVDVFLWRILPFQNFDVLYVISFVILTLHHLKKKANYLLHLLFAALFCTWLAISALAPYRFEIQDLSLNHLFQVNFTETLLRFLSDGWFPILPWLLIGWTGAYFARYKLTERKEVKITATLLFLFGLYYFQQNPVNEGRNGYLEIFYPVHFPFLCLSLGAIALALWGTQYLQQLTSSKNPICVLGRNSLFVYILHCGINAFLISNLNWAVSVGTHVLAYFLLLSMVFLLTYAKERYVGNAKKLPNWLRLVSGM